MAKTMSYTPYQIPLPPSPPNSPFTYPTKGYSSPPHLTAPDTPARSPIPSSVTGGSPGAPSRSVSAVSRSSERPRSDLEQSKMVIKEVKEEETKKSPVKLEDFELVRVLGKGCAGRVLLVRHTPTTSLLAMKAISKRAVLTHDELNHTLTELSILKTFAIKAPDNRFISKLKHAFTDKENFYFVMDFYPGGDLATQMEVHRTLGATRTRFYAADIVQGLEDLHRHGIIVRDLKPENILLNARGHAVLADFGLSKEFGYRGKPRSITLEKWEDMPVVPEWAGKGLGSKRVSEDGIVRIVVDRAWSFVGTSEYLSPEVIERGEYSYAVDWWAVGCIVLEGLVGRVPFRKEDWEEPMVLWEKVLHDPWDEFLYEAVDGLDDVTWHFLDSLLEKHPHYRLNEPYVKTHEYFTGIEWDLVARGEYEDPHNLELHPTAEYNTRYFPKLCLKEVPSVDMSTHPTVEEKEGQTPLNDDAIYKFELLKHRKELEGFAWSAEEVDMEDDLEEKVDSGRMGDLSLAGSTAFEFDDSVINSRRTSIGEGQEGDATTIPDMIDPTEEDNQQQAVEALHPDQRYPASPKLVTPGSSLPALASINESIDSSTPTFFTTSEKDRALQEISTRLRAPPVIKAPNKIHEDTPDPRRIAGRRSAAAGSEHVAAQDDPFAPVLGSTFTEARTQFLETPNRRPSHGTSHSANPLDEQQIFDENTTTPVPIPSISDTGGKPREDTPDPRHIDPDRRPSASPIPIFHAPTRLHRNLPSGLPASGLSVSDVIAITQQSLTLGNSHRFIRRHLPAPNTDSTPLPRLSVEMNGTVTQLDDEEWEELEGGSGLESVPNGGGGGGPSTFFSRGLGQVLRRRPSTLTTSGLRRQTKSSDSSSRSRDSSPTKMIRPKEGLTLTKKALDKLKVFPRLRRSEHKITRAVGQGDDSKPRTEVEGGGRRQTQSGWFERKPKLRRKTGLMESASQPESLGLRRGEEKESDKAQKIKTDGTKGIPRVELRETEPVIWQFGPRE